MNESRAPMPYILDQNKRGVFVAVSQDGLFLRLLTVDLPVGRFLKETAPNRLDICPFGPRHLPAPRTSGPSFKTPCLRGAAGFGGRSEVFVCRKVGENVIGWKKFFFLFFFSFFFEGEGSERLETCQEFINMNGWYFALLMKLQNIFCMCKAYFSRFSDLRIKVWFFLLVLVLGYMDALCGQWGSQFYITTAKTVGGHSWRHEIWGFQVAFFLLQRCFGS